MAATSRNTYVPGMYAKKRTSTAMMVDQCIRAWEMQKKQKKKQATETGLQASQYICFSRKIGVGALEIADILAEKIGWKVVDREIMEHIAEHHSLGRDTIDEFDEKYPGKINEFFSFMFGEKSFTMSDYMRHLVKAVIEIAETGPTIFVGRATHLILPRDNVLSVRFISSREHRIKRVADILNISAKEAAGKLDKEDKLQVEFFEKNFGKKDASPYEFDMVINRDYIAKAQDAAELVHQAYALKFSDVLTRVEV